MPRCVNNARFNTARAEDIALARGTVDTGILGRLHTQPRGLQVEMTGKRGIFLMHGNRRSRERAELMRAADVIDVCVRDHDQLQVEPMAIENIDDFADIVARIDNDRFMCGFVADDRTIAAQHAHRQYFMNHDGWTFIYIRSVDILNIVMRALHILSAVTLVGGVLAWRFAAIPGTEALDADSQRKAGDAIAAAWRPVVLFSILGLLISGIYNFLHKTGMPPAYHALFGIKFLLALHVFAVVLIAAKPGNEKRRRQLTGVAYSGVTIVIISAILRWISTQ